MMSKTTDYFERLQAGTAIVLDTHFSMLFSLKRNEFFEHLEPFLAYYASYNAHLKKQHSNDPAAMNRLNTLPDIPFENYSISPIFLFLMLMALPVTFIIFILQWNYVKEVQRKLKEAALIYHEIITR